MNVNVVQTRVAVTMSVGKSVESEGAAEQWSECLASIAKDRSRERFLALYEHFAPRVKAHLRGLGADEAQAEDLAQETLLSVWRKAAHFDAQRAAASTWIFRIARNLRIDQLRRDAARPEEPGEPAAAEAPDATGDSAADQGRVRAALSELPLMQAQSVYRSYYLGQSHSEIATALQIPLGSVKSNLRLAFQALRRNLGVNV